MSLTTRGFVVLLLTVCIAVLPIALFDARERAAAQKTVAAAGTAALASLLDQHLRTQPPTPADTLAAVQADKLREASASLRWAGAFRRDGVGIEFVRRVVMPREMIVGQLDFESPGPTLRPLQIPGGESAGWQLLTLPSATPGVVVAAIVEAADNAAPLGQLRAAWIAAPLAALGGGALFFYLLIVRPVRRVSHLRSAGANAGLSAAALASGDTPAELLDLAQRMEQTEHELARWRAEAGALRYTVDRRVAAQTDHADRAVRAAERAADTDALTGLHNRRVLERELPPSFAAEQAGGDLSVIWFDIDNFKPFNDTRGHQAGDELIHFVGELLRSAARRDRDLAIRYGGDEFVLVLVGTPLHAAAEIAQRLAALFAQHVRTLGKLPAAPGLSAGVASVRRSSPRDADDLLRIADEAMYEAKRTRMTVVTADPAGRR